MLYVHAQSLFGDAEPARPIHDASEYIDLGYSLSTAFDLWAAWKDHHVMPCAGGYLDQPRRWRDLIHQMNRRFNPQYEQAKQEHAPIGNQPEEEGDVLDEFLSAPFADGTRPSWERFAHDTEP